MERRRRQQRLDPFPEPVRHPPAIVSADKTHLVASLVADEEEFDPNQRVPPTGIGSKAANFIGWL
jgi:hypothetical protein